MNIIIFDVETNGFKGTSVLSFSAMKVNYNIETKEFSKVAVLDRYYYREPHESVELSAIKVNGLTDTVIAEKREGHEYAKHFKDDKDIEQFFNDTLHYIAHNIKFDASFVPLPKNCKMFDTMHTNVNIVKAGWNSYYQTYKWPKLSETAAFYELKLDSEQLHNSLYDVVICFKVFYSMSKYAPTSKIVESFLNS